MSEFNVWLVGGGLVIGAIFAIMVQRFRFCLVAGASNLILIKDYRQIMAFASALLVAITGTQLLELFDIVAIAETSYRNTTLDWFGAAFGGFVFGVGATFAGGCAVRTLVKTMEGSLHALLALLTFAVVAAITQFGMLEPARLELTHITAIMLASDAGIGSVMSISPWIVLAVVDIALVLFLVNGWKRCPDKTMLIVGGIIGLLVVASWIITGLLAQDEFNPSKPSAMILSGPLARFGYFLISGNVPVLSFAIAFAIGLAVAAFLLALSSGQFKVRAPAKGMAKMAIIGGALMGVGAILAYGCNVGQGLSGISTLSVESLIAVVSMVAGISAVTKWMESRS